MIQENNNFEKFGIEEFDDEEEKYISDYLDDYKNSNENTEEAKSLMVQKAMSYIKTHPQNELHYERWFKYLQGLTKFELWTYIGILHEYSENVLEDYLVRPQQNFSYPSEIILWLEKLDMSPPNRPRHLVVIEKTFLSGIKEALLSLLLYKKKNVFFSNIWVNKLYPSETIFLFNSNHIEYDKIYQMILNLDNTDQINESDFNSDHGKKLPGFRPVKVFLLDAPFLEWIKNKKKPFFDLNSLQNYPFDFCIVKDTVWAEEKKLSEKIT